MAFYLDTPHDRLDEIRDTWRDGERIAEMVVPLSVADANARLDRFGAERMYHADCEAHLYTCRNFDDATRLCTIYDERPEMCRVYPASCDTGCEYGCGYVAPADVVAKWTLLTTPRRACPPRDPLTQR